MRFLSRVWKRWVRMAEFIGNVQMVVILTLIYWTMLAVVAIPLKFFDDPLTVRKPDRIKWVQREAPESVLDSMRKQG